MCKTPSELYGAINAKAAVDDGPIFDPKHINEASFSAQMSFSKYLNKAQDKQAKVNISQYTKDKVGWAANIVNNMRTPEALIPAKVYGKVDRKMTQWNAFYQRSYRPKLDAITKKYETLMGKVKDPDKLRALELKKQAEMDPLRKQAEKSYRTLVGKQFQQANKQLQQVFNQHGANPKKLDAELKKMGMTRRDAYYTHQYFNWLENGGPYFEFNKGGGNKSGGEMTQNLVSTVTGKKISFDPKQVVYNTMEFIQKAPAVAGFNHTMGGVVDAIKAAHGAKLTVFDRLPELEKAGIYSSDHNPLRPQSQHDTTMKSQNFLDNMAYFTGKRMGDVPKAMAGIAYRPKPWNDTFGFQDPWMKGNFSFMSFQMRHMQQYGGWWKGAIKGSPDAARALAIYSVMTGIAFGDRSAMPAPVWAIIKALHPGVDKEIKAFQKDIPIVGELLNTGVVGTTAKALTGGNLELDMTKYTQPGGGIVLGVGQDMVNTATDALTNTVPKAGKQIREGKPGKAIAVAIDGITQASQLHQNGANAFVQKTISGVAKAYIEDEFTPEGIAEHVGQKYFGKDAVSAAK